MDNEACWYYLVGGHEQRGPLPWVQVAEAHRAGIISCETLLWAPHLSGWVAARELIPPPLPAVGREPAPTCLDAAPGARAARLCGLWALIALLPCLPLATLLATAALVQHGKASRLAREHPERYRTPGNAGLVLGILALVLLPFVLALLVGLARELLGAGRVVAGRPAAISGSCRSTSR